jgi:2-keto-4-pentenoate hydratase/2-oxohepta-3-ene-1,7-dioic acid hydratase in catechol pathway
MKYARYEWNGAVTWGVVDGDSVTAIAGTPFDGGPQSAPSGAAASLDAVRLLAPVQPGKMLAMALNYADHLGDREPPKKPDPFYKVPTSIIGPGDAIVLPTDVGRVDEEGELAIVIGRTCKRVSPADALDYVFGCTCGNDVSARVWQRGDISWWRAKSSDTFAPLGPFLVTGLDMGHLDLQVRIDGTVAQEGNTSALIYDIPTMVSFISQVLTLDPGDVIFTGTPGIPGQLTPGCTVEVEIEGIGVLSNPVKAE